MAALIPPPPRDPTLDAMRVAIEDKAFAEAYPRTYLGMSSIGRPCERQLWYDYRWVFQQRFDAPTLWRFEDGFRCEDVQAGRLRLVPGVHLRTLDPRSGKQFGHSDIGGHFRGHMDGMIEGILQAPSTLHVWEAKASNEKKIAELQKLKSTKGEKATLAAWDETYYAQAILYMAYSETTRHYLTASTPGAREMVSVRTDTNLDVAARLREKAERIIMAQEPPPKLSESPAWFQCKMCPAFGVCHGDDMPAVGCRTCAHATPELDGDGRWSCAIRKRDITTREQRLPCEHHRYIPALLKKLAKPVDASEPENWVQYEMPDGRVFRNGAPGPRSYTSEELRDMDRAMICDATADSLRVSFNGQHVATEAA